MSETNPAGAHDEAHTGPVKTPKQLLITVFFSFVIPIFIIIALVNFVTSSNKPIAGVSDEVKLRLERIQKVGTVEVRDANREMKSGETVYQAQCAGCHGAGLAGSPKFGLASAWSPRIKQGYDILFNSALKGKNAMGAQGGGDYDDFEIARAVVYMANKGGAKFPEPQQPVK